jgi:DNA polymerase-3 subunit epsilon
MTFIIFDTETNFLPTYRRDDGTPKPADDPDQPRLAEIGMHFADEDLNLIPAMSFHAYVKPDGWEMKPDATAKNGLTTEQLLKVGKPIQFVLDHYTAAINAPSFAGVICFNAQFDCKIMRGELRRAGMPDLFERTANICTMSAMRGMGVKKLNGKGGQPRLVDVCAHFDIPFDETKFHGAVYDALKTLDVAKAMKAAGILPQAMIHYAKNYNGGETSA